MSTNHTTQADQGKTTVEKIYDWIDSHLEKILWISFTFFCLLLFWVLYSFFSCSPATCIACEFKSWLDFSINFVGILGGGLISVMGALFHHGKTVKDTNTKDVLNTIPREVLSKQYKKILEEIKKINSKEASSVQSKQHFDARSDVCIEALQEDKALANKIISCLKERDIVCLPPIGHPDSRIYVQEVLEERVKSSVATFMICNSTESVTWVRNRLTLYHKLTEERLFPCFPNILIGHNNIDFSRDFELYKNLGVEFISYNLEVSECEQLESLINDVVKILHMCNDGDALNVKS